MITEEQQINTAAAMYKRRRDYMAFVTPKRYAEETAVARKIIAAKLREHDGNHLGAAMAIIKAVPNTPPAVVACIISAALDMIEGKPRTPATPLAPIATLPANPRQSHGAAR